MIQANCRNNFTIDDFQFITETLSLDEKNKIALTELLSDENMRDEILDHELLFTNLLKSDGLTSVSPYLYFYILIRKAFTAYKINDRQLADYVAAMLAEYSTTKRAFSLSEDSEKQYHYLTDMLTDFNEATTSFEAFLLQSHLGNYALFMSGMFPDFIYRKATYGRTAPGFDYYEKMGSSGYHWASRHKYAEKYSLVEILAQLANDFRTVRVALNTLVDEYLSMDDREDDMDTVLRKIFYGPSQA